MPTYYDLGRRGARESWRALRRRRAAQPIPGRDGARAETFRSSLEQAEQQFLAAAAVGYDSRALNLFYGLSQAERAIAAAAAGEDWKLAGHGIQAKGLGGGSDVLGLALKPGPLGDRGNFTRLSSLLGSDVPERLTLGETWPLLFETVLHERAQSATPAPLSVTIDGETVPSDGRTAVGAQIGVESAWSSPGRRWWDTDPMAVSEFLDRYPQLDGWERELPDGSPVAWPPQPPGNQLRLRWTGDEFDGGMSGLRDRLTLYRRERVAYPVLAGRDAVMHPLMAWHAVLFGLSMLTRYEPARWTRTIDVDHNPRATVVEYVLDLALDAVPDLIDEALDKVS